MTDTLDELLHAHGRQWAAAQPSPPELGGAILTATRQRRPRPVLAVVTAIAVVAAVAVIPITRSLIDSHTSRQPASANDPVLQALADRAETAAAADGDAHATADAVRTSLGEALRVATDGGVSADAPVTTVVWLIQIRGNFTCFSCRSAIHGSPPTGTAILLIVNAETLVEYSDGLWSEPRDISGLGTVTTLPMW